jgi:ADP-heptose:LPS heptosyltransferase
MVDALPDLKHYRSVLIVKPSSLGDIVHTLPSVALLRQAYRHLRIRWIANPEWLPLLEGSSCVDETIPFPRRKLRGIAAPLHYTHWASEFRELPREDPELILDFQGLFRSAMIANARGSRPIIGLSDAREGASFFCDNIIPVDPAAHAVDRYLCLPAALGVTRGPDPLPWPLPEGTPPADSLPEDYVLLHPWSRGEGKSMPADALARFIEVLAPRPIVLVGMTQEPVASLPRHVTSLVNQTSLAQLIWLMRKARWNISVDSGPMHIAAAVNPRTLGIHTWSDPRKVGPYCEEALVWKAGRVAHRREFTRLECQSERAFVEADVEAAVQVLSEAASS